MKNEDLYDELLIKYLLNEISAEDEDAVLKWLAEDEHNRQYFEELKNTWRLAALKDTVGKIEVENEWIHFQKSKDIKAAVIHELLPDILYEEDEKKVKNSFRIWTSIAVAASILLVIGFGWKMLFEENKTVPVAKTTQPDERLLAILQHEVNKSNKVRVINLEDGSVIALEPNSEVTFLKPFVQNKRDINLTGKASFTVAKNKAKPFTVYSSDLSTTALGTAFTVTAFKRAKSITVRLFEGKVVVKSVDSAINKLKKDIYLLPGEELIYNKKMAIAKVWSFKKETTFNGQKTSGGKDNPQVPDYEKGNWIMFNNQSVAQVFEQLEEIYNKEIIFSKSDVHKKYFIGKFDKEAPLDTILKQIVKLNSLNMTKENDKYIITKQ